MGILIIGDSLNILFSTSQSTVFIMWSNVSKYTWKSKENVENVPKCKNVLDKLCVLNKNYLYQGFSFCQSFYLFILMYSFFKLIYVDILTVIAMEDF